MKSLLSLLIICSIFLLSCQSKIDGSNLESYEKSISQIKSELNEKQKIVFKDCLGAIGMKNISPEKLLKEAFKNAFNGEEMDKSALEDIAKETLSKMDGKSYEDVINEGKQILLPKYKSIIEEANSNKVAAKSEIEKVKSDLINLEKIQIVETDLRKGRYSFSPPTIKILIKNNSEILLSKIGFYGELFEKGRKISNCKDSFTYQISGGLEPTEQKKWYLEPNMMSDLYDCRIPSKREFKLKVTSVSDIDDKVIWSTEKSVDDINLSISELEKEIKLHEGKIDTLNSI